MTAAPLFIDKTTGLIRLPGRVTRTLTDTQTLAAAALPVWFVLAGGTLSSATWTAATGDPPGAFKATTPVGTPFLSGIKGAAPFATFAPYRFEALALTFEGLCFDADSGFTASLGFFPAAASKGGAYIAQDAAGAEAYVGVYDSTGVLHKISVQYQFFSNTGSAGPKRRNITVLWAVHSGLFYVLEDDQVIAAVDISAYVDTADNCYPALFISSTGATQHFVQWSQSKMVLNHN